MASNGTAALPAALSAALEAPSSGSRRGGRAPQVQVQVQAAAGRRLETGTGGQVRPTHGGAASRHIDHMGSMELLPARAGSP